MILQKKYKMTKQQTIPCDRIEWNKITEKKNILNSRCDKLFLSFTVKLNETKGELTY